MDDERRVAARMAQVLGAPQKIEPIDTPALGAGELEMIRAVRAGVGRGTGAEIPEYFRVAVKNPALFRAQMQIGAMLFTGSLPPRERELAVLRLAWLIGAPYEWGEHVPIAKRYGVNVAEVERCVAGSAAPGWSAHDAAILRGVEELLDDRLIADATWDTLAETWDEAQLLEFPMLVGTYLATAFQQNSIRLRLSATNPGLAAR